MDIYWDFKLLGNTSVVEHFEQRQGERENGLMNDNKTMFGFTSWTDGAAFTGNVTFLSEWNIKSSRRRNRKWSKCCWCKQDVISHCVITVNAALLRNLWPQQVSDLLKKKKGVVHLGNVTMRLWNPKNILRHITVWLVPGDYQIFCWVTFLQNHPLVARPVPSTACSAGISQVCFIVQVSWMQWLPPSCRCLPGSLDVLYLHLEHDQWRKHLELKSWTHVSMVTR